MKKRLLIIDGQGGRLGSALIARIHEKMKSPETVEMIAVGTNAIATSAMLKAGADVGATGEYPVIFHAARSEVIVGPVGIVAAGALCGEISPKMAEAVALSTAEKVLIPSDKCSMHIVGRALPLAEYIENAADLSLKLLEEADK